MEQVLREASISVIKFVNQNITLQTVVRSRIEQTLCSMPLTSEKTKTVFVIMIEKKEKQRPNKTFKRSQLINTNMVVNAYQSNYQRSIYP